MISINLKDLRVRDALQIQAPIGAYFSFTILGKIRTITVEVAKFHCHYELIIKYCDGAMIELKTTEGWKNTLVTPNWDIGTMYRVKVKREPKPGEVWMHSGVPWMLAAYKSYVSLSGERVMDFNHSHDFTYSAPSVKAYYAREFISIATEHDQVSGRVLLHEVALAARIGE